MKLVLTLFHGKASVEQEFSISNSAHNSKLKEDTIMGKNIYSSYEFSEAKTAHNKNKQKSGLGGKKRFQ